MIPQSLSAWVRFLNGKMIPSTVRFLNGLTGHPKIAGRTHVGIPGITRIRRHRLRRKNPIRNLKKTLLLTAQVRVSKVKANMGLRLSS
jgi:hypothetical protein